jgi:2-keto-4-pentenoate hydratase
MNNNLIEKFAENFFNTFYKGSWNDKIQYPISDMSIQESYIVQDLVAKKKIARGERTVGYKVGCTSSAIQSQFGLNEPILGRLFWPHIFDDKKELNWKRFTNCAIEPEMVLKIGKDLKGENLSDEVLINAIEYISPGIEIHNYKFWLTPPTLQELVCSNGIHAGLVVGDVKISPGSLSFESEWFKVYEGDKIITKAKASEIMGGPLHSLRWLIGKLTKRNEILRSGSYVIPGSPVELININEDTKLSIFIEKVGKAVAYFKS